MLGGAAELPWSAAAGIHASIGPPESRHYAQFSISETNVQAASRRPGPNLEHRFASWPMAAAKVLATIALKTTRPLSNLLLVRLDARPAADCCCRCLRFWFFRQALCLPRPRHTKATTMVRLPAVECANCRSSNAAHLVAFRRTSGSQVTRAGNATIKATTQSCSPMKGQMPEYIC
jgi:hypothetical protein